MRGRLFLCAMIVAVALPGCDTSPTEIDGGEQVLQGTVGVQETSRHDITITSAGGVRFEVESIVQDPPLPEGITESLGFNLGEPNENDLCAFTFQSTINASSNLAFGLLERVYCIVIADNGTIPEDAVRTYSIVVRTSE